MLPQLLLFVVSVYLVVLETLVVVKVVVPCLVVEVAVFDYFVVLVSAAVVVCY